MWMISVRRMAVWVVMGLAGLFAMQVEALAAELGETDQKTHDALLLTFDQHFFPERVPDNSFSVDVRNFGAKHAHDSGEGWACLTGLVMELKENWDLFTPAEKKEMTEILAPWKDDLLDSRPAADPDAPPPPSPCLDYYYDDYVESEHFSVQWSSGFSASEADEFIESLEYSWDVEVEELGWEQPEGTPQYQTQVIVYPGNYAGAYTTVEWCSGVGYVPYIVAYTGSFSTGSWWKTMACHEFAHASQFSYGYAHEFWWWEASATYIEEYVYPQFNDWADMTYVYSMVPYIGMNASAGNSNDQYLFYHTYAMAIWGFYLDQHVGGHDLVLETWEYSANRTGQYNLWMPTAIDGAGEDFDEIYPGFLAVNAFMDYDESNYFYDADITESVSEYPNEGNADSDTKPQSLGQNFIRFRGSSAEDGDTLTVEFDGDDGPTWFAILAKGSSSVDEVVEFDLDSDGAGVASIVMDGYQDVFLVVSPMDDDAVGYSYDWSRADDWDYNWSAYLNDDLGQDDASDGSSSGGDGGSSGGGKDKGRDNPLCGCSSTRGSGLFGWFALGLGAVLMRRRRN